MAPKWFRFANAFERLSCNCLDQLVNASKFFWVGGLPVKVVLPSFFFKPNDHLMSVFGRRIADSKWVLSINGCINWRIDQFTNHALTGAQPFNRLG